VAAIKLDENVPDSVGMLREGGHDVALARDEGLAGEPDDRLLTTASVEGRVLVTLDRDFTNILRHPPMETAGIVVFRLREQNLPAIRRTANALAALLSQESVRGCLWVLDESRVRMWPR
jgi:predicted nuclease of predicted toxin-antitoxin system